MNVPTPLPRLAAANYSYGFLSQKYETLTSKRTPKTQKQIGFLSVISRRDYANRPKNHSWGKVEDHELIETRWGAEVHPTHDGEIARYGKQQFFATERDAYAWAMAQVAKKLAKLA